MGSVSVTRTQSVVRWIFRDRRTGRIVIAQRPNVALLTWLVATVVSWFLHGSARTVIGVLATIALVIWACDEIVRGVNPWRRTLGAVVLVVVLVSRLGSA